MDWLRRMITPEWEAVIALKEEEERNLPTVFPVPTDGPLAAAHAVLEETIRAIQRLNAFGKAVWESTSAADRVKALSPSERGRVVAAAVERAAWAALQPHEGAAGNSAWAGIIARDLLREFTVHLDTELRRRMLDALPLAPGARLSELCLYAIVPPIAAGFREPGADAALRPRALELRKVMVSLAHQQPRMREALDALEEGLLGGHKTFLDPFEPWSARVLGEIDALGPAEHGAWMKLLAHLRDLSSARPSGKWAKTLRALLAGVGGDAFRTRAQGWIAAMRDGADEPFSARNGDFARGMAWCLAELGTDDDARLLGELALLCAAKIPEIGQRSAKAANASIAALGEMPGDAPIAQITRLRARIKYAQTQALIEKTLLAAATRRGLPAGELEELAAPVFGMDEPGVLRVELGEWTAEVRVAGTARVETEWVAPGGRRQKTAPAAVRESHAGALRELKKTEKEMQDALAAQRARLEALPMEGRAIPFGAWRERYLDHPLLADMCRRLVWRFETGGRTASGAWLDGALVDARDRPLEGMEEGTAVRPWHPLDAEVDEIAAWRAWLDRHGVTQPFKQAHREVYRLTDAERETGVYSNRFAAHVLRQHQLAALARGRGWQYQLQGAYDRWSAPTLRIPGTGLRAEFRVDPVEHGDDDESGVARYVTTDQVRFLDAADRPVLLESVPALAFSEAMRDVDLFVGVASVGTDPTWADGGTLGVRDYWDGFAFGALSATAQTRRDVLQRLLPRLAIAGACSLEERFLAVRGRLHTYRIHLGSGNVLMEPGSAYLCIVPDRLRSPAEPLPLPFEGDAMLSVILSKAFLLADDDQITDPVIRRQIR